jgi:hypothetical protein
MGRIFSGKPIRDTETAAESLIVSDMTSSTLRKMDETVVRMTVNASLHFDKQIDENGEKKF